MDLSIRNELRIPIAFRLQQIIQEEQRIIAGILNFLFTDCQFVDRAVQYVAQFPYTSVCNRYIFSSLKRKFLSEIAHLLTFNMYKDWLLDRCIFKIKAFSPKLLSCPVFVHLTQFPYIGQNTIFP